MSLIPENNMERILNGEDVTPSCRAEYFVKQAIANAGSGGGGGGGGESYETVAEIEVGTMEHDGNYFAYFAEGVTVPTINESETYYLNNKDMPSGVVSVDEENRTIGFNTEDFDHYTPIDPANIVVVVNWSTDGIFYISSDKPFLSNTTVKILKKVSGGETITVDSELSDTSENPVQNKVITAALGDLKPTYEFGFTVTTVPTEDELIVTPDSGSTYAAIAAALAETPNVYAVLDLGFQNQVIRALFSVDSTASGAESTSAICMFWSGTKWMGAQLIVSASGADILVREL